MSNITGLLKNFIDRLNPFYQSKMLKGKKLFLILVGASSLEDNQEEISDIINWFKGVSEWFPFEFEFLYYFSSGNSGSIRNEYDNYEEIINNIKNKIVNQRSDL